MASSSPTCHVVGFLAVVRVRQPQGEVSEVGVKVCFDVRERD